MEKNRDHAALCSFCGKKKEARERGEKRSLPDPPFLHFVTSALVCANGHSIAEENRDKEEQSPKRRKWSFTRLRSEIKADFLDSNTSFGAKTREEDHVGGAVHNQLQRSTPMSATATFEIPKSPNILLARAHRLGPKNAVGRGKRLATHMKTCAVCDRRRQRF